MKKTYSTPHTIKTIAEWHQLFHLPKPLHPLISIVDASLIRFDDNEIWKHFCHDFYCVSVKQGYNCKLKYGRREYDFDEGVMIFTKPGQVFQILEADGTPVTGMILVFKEDFIRSYPLAKTIQNYGFFSYALSESLHLSDLEQTTILSMFQQVQQELKTNIDSFSQEILVNHIDLMLSYANRFYNRQFITRKNEDNDLLILIDQLLSEYYNTDKMLSDGIPTVQYVAQQLNVSSNYLSDMLRSTTGQTTQQHIHNKLIEKAKELLTSTSLSVSEIAYQLGFEYPQSFNKLFKNKTQRSPLEFRESFN